jgi:hypothetical protein
VFGSVLSTPIINPPQSAILGMHATNMRPWVVNGQILPRCAAAAPPSSAIARSHVFWRGLGLLLLFSVAGHSWPLHAAAGFCPQNHCMHLFTHRRALPGGLSFFLSSCRPIMNLALTYDHR